MNKEDLTIAHTSGKYPFLSQYGGLYHPSEKSISIGTGTKATAHEIIHALDWASKIPDQPLYDYKLLAIAKANMNTGVEKAISLSRKEGEELEDARRFRIRMGAYWYRVEEVWARLIEQYIAYKNPIQTTAYDSFNYYTKSPGWWKETSFIAMLPMIEVELKRKLELAKSKI